MDSMRRVAAGAVRKNLGPDPSMGRKVELLRRLVAMRQERKGPKARVPENVRDDLRLRPPGPDRGVPRRPGGGPRRSPRPARFNDKPGYNFGPPRGM